MVRLRGEGVQPVGVSVRKPRKREEASRRLQEMISGQRLWGQRLMGERELAGELGVGRQTVRAVLDDLAALGVVERRQGSGTYVAEREVPGRRPSTAEIAIIADAEYHREAGWVYKGEMMRAMLGWGRRLKVRCTVFSLADEEARDRVWDAKHMGRYSGYVVVQRDDHTLLSHLVRLRRGPVALLDHTVRDLPVVGVVNGDMEGGRATTRHLLALGHTRIGFIDCYNSPLNNPQRIAGYSAALFEKGLEYDEDLVVAQPRAASAMSDPDFEKFSEDAVGRLLRLADPPTAIFAFNDTRALPVVAALGRRGLVVGENYCLAGYGDSAIRRGVCDWLTSCRIYPRMMGREALKAVLAGGELREGRTIIVPDRLQIRRSTCPPRPCGFGGLGPPAQPEAAPLQRDSDPRPPANGGRDDRNLDEGR
jgi:DNA-binding LacI/PurR family transcriptional regulator